jgi:hypothetical protein
LRERSGFLKPIIVVQLVAVMMLAGLGTAFAVEPHVAAPTATPGASATPISQGSLEITGKEEIYNPEVTQVIGVIVTVKNKDTAAAHSGTVYVAIEQEGETITGQGYITNLAAGDSIQVTVDLEPVPIPPYLQKLRIAVTQTS